MLSQQAQGWAPSQNKQKAEENGNRMCVSRVGWGRRGTPTHSNRATSSGDQRGPGPQQNVCLVRPHAAPEDTHVPVTATGEGVSPALTCCLVALEVYDTHPLEAGAALFPSRIDQGEVPIGVPGCLRHRHRVGGTEKEARIVTRLHMKPFAYHPPSALT